MAYLVKISAIYIITSIIDSKYYIGRSVHSMERFSKHRSLLRKRAHDNPHLQLAWNKYGEGNFIFEILEEYPKELLPSMENWWCNMLNVHDRTFGYNIDPTNPNGKVSSSKETIEKIRIANTGKICSQETRDKLRIINTGKSSSQETREKLKNSKKNIKIDAYDKEGMFVKTFKSLREAERELNIKSKGISDCLSGKFNLIKGYIFMRHGDILSKEDATNRYNNSLEATKRAVIGHTLDGVLIGEFNSFYQAGKATNQDPYKISLCCRGIQKRVKNIVWCYLDK